MKHKEVKACYLIRALNMEANTLVQVLVMRLPRVRGKLIKYKQWGR